MDTYKRLRAIEFHSRLDECILEINTSKWNPRSLNKIIAFLETDSSCVNEAHPFSVQTVKLPWWTVKRAFVKLGYIDKGKCPLELVRVLVNYGANVSISDYSWIPWTSPLQMAVQRDFSIDIVKLLLFAGARIAATIGHDKDTNVLVAALDKFLENRSQKKLEELKLLVRHLFLEDPDFELELFIRRSVENLRGKSSWCPQLEGLVKFSNECYRQVQVMRSKNSCLNSSLFYFVKRRMSPRMAYSGYRPPSLSNKEFSQLVSIMAANDLSHYVELTAHTVGMSTMVTKLREFQVYAGSALDDEKTFLNHDSLLQIVRFLSLTDLMRLLIAYAPENCVRHEYKSVRSNECTVKNLNKRQKL